MSYFCLVSSDEIPSINIPGLDKCVHIVFHIGLTFLWFLFFSKQLQTDTVAKAFLYSVLLSFVFGIAIEILQEVFTTTRSADILDVLANVTGEAIAVLIISVGIKHNIFSILEKK